MFFFPIFLQTVKTMAKRERKARKMKTTERRRKRERKKRKEPNNKTFFIETKNSTFFHPNVQQLSFFFSFKISSYFFRHSSEQIFLEKVILCCAFTNRLEWYLTQSPPHLEELFRFNFFLNRCQTLHGLL